jgi:hypothetical protein
MVTSRPSRLLQVQRKLYGGLATKVVNGKHRVIAEPMAEVVHFVPEKGSVLVMTSSHSHLKSHQSGIFKRITQTDPKISRTVPIKRRGGSALKDIVGRRLLVLGPETVEDALNVPINHLEQKYDS